MTTDRLDTLIDALIDLDCSTEDVRELGRLVGEHDGHAQRVAGAIEAERLLRRAGEAAARSATEVTMPPVTAAPAPTPCAGRSHRRRLSLGASWAITGVSVAVSALMLVRPTPPAQPMPLAGANGTPATHVSNGGEVLGELPPQTLGLRQRPDGRVEVVFLRAQVEQTAVSDVFKVARDEHGRPVPVRSGVIASAKRQAM